MRCPKYMKENTMKKIQTETALSTINSSAQCITMSSREIAELTGKRHDHVIRDIEHMLEELGETSPQIWGHLPDAYNRPQRAAFLPKDLTITLVSGYNVQMRYAITKRWLELEAHAEGTPVPVIPTDLPEALRLAADLVEQKEQLRIENEALKPAATIGAAVGARKGTSVMEFVRKLPGVNTRQVHKKLAELGYIRKRKGTWSVPARSKKYFVEAFDRSGLSVITLTVNGMELVSRLYLAGQFQMLKGAAPVGAEKLEQAAYV